MQQDKEGVEFRKILEFADLKGKHVLEVGCGNGRVSEMLRSHAKSLVAIDPDQARLTLAKSNVPGVDFRLGRGEELEFPAESFDLVAFTFSLHHQDSTRALAEAHRVLKPSGFVLVVEPSVEGDMHPFFRAFRNEDTQIADAQTAIASGKFSCLKAGTFDIQWLFDDAEDVYAYFFQHVNISRDETYVRIMAALLGAKAAERPILLAETVNIYSLKKI